MVIIRLTLVHLDNYMTTYVKEPASYVVDKVIDANGCQSIENEGVAIVLSRILKILKSCLILIRLFVLLIVQFS